MSIAQIALAWVLTRPGVGGAIVGGTSAKHIDRTLQAAQALAPALTAEQQSRLSEASSGAGGAIAAGDCYTIERDPSTPSGAALAPWTNVGTLAKPPHWEELKRRTLETLRLLVRPPRLSAPQIASTTIMGRWWHTGSGRGGAVPAARRRRGGWTACRLGCGRRRGCGRRYCDMAALAAGASGQLWRGR